jgi:putative MATE family efflux protein
MVEPKIRRDLTTGSVLKNVFVMGVPSMIGFGAMTIYHITDIYWLGRLGVAEVAAVTMFGAFAWVIGSINQVVGTGSVAMISRRYGEKEYDRAVNVIKQTLVLKFTFAVVMGTIGILLVGRILGIMGAEPSVVTLGSTYGRIYFLGLPFSFCMYTIYTALRGVGDATKAMYIMLFTTFLNAVLDPVLIFPVGMGIAGAATATVFSSLTAVAIGIYVLSSGRTNVVMKVRQRFRPDIGTMVEMLKIGIPPGFESISRSVGSWIVILFIASFGTGVVAAYGISQRIIELGILFAVGLGLGGSALVGQNLGAEKPDRAEETAVKGTLLALGITGVLAIVESVFARQLMGVFTSDAEVIERGIMVVRLLALVQPFVGITIVLSSAFYGSGHTWPPTIVGIAVVWLLEIPLIAAAVHLLNTNEVGVWASILFANAVSSVVIYFWFKKGTWKLKRV